MNTPPKIVQDPHDVLRDVANTVLPSEFGTDKLRDIVQSMHDSLATQKDGVALAAPQIGISKRIFVVAESAFHTYMGQPLVYINPVITGASKEKIWVEEGCLSVRWMYGKAHRHAKATVKAQNVNGNTFTQKGSGLLAQIFQHEIDHLEGILFHDHATDLHELTDDEVADYQKRLDN